MDLNALYQQLLGRAPDAGATSFYNGMGADQVRGYITASPEYQARQQTQPATPAAASSGFNSSFYVPQSLLDSMGITSAQAQAGQFKPVTDPWQGYTPQPQSSGTVLDALNVAKQAAAGQGGNYAAGSWQSNVANAVNPSLATPAPTPTTGTGTGTTSPYDKQMADLLKQIQTQQSTLSGLQKGWDTFQTNFNQNAQYGGVFGNQTSPTYSPQSKNGYGAGWGGSNPFKIGSF